MSGNSIFTLLAVAWIVWKLATFFERDEQRRRRLDRIRAARALRLKREAESVRVVQGQVVEEPIDAMVIRHLRGGKQINGANRDFPRSLGRPGTGPTHDTRR